MKKNIKIIYLLTSGLVSIVSATSMEEFKENITEKCNKGVQQGEDLADHLAKIDTNQLPAAKTEIMMKREMVGSTVLEQVTFNAINEFSHEAEKIDTKYFKGELKSRVKEETQDQKK